MRSGIGRKIIEAASGTALTSAQLFVAIATAGYGASYGKIMSKLDEIQARGGQGVKKPAEFKRKRNSFYTTLYRMKRDGLIESKNGGWLATAKGKKVISEGNVYQKEADSTVKIVIFDVPEGIASKRAWLRSALKNLGFKMLQKSVWVGKVKLPEHFIRELRSRNLIDYVEIFGVTKSGSLKNIDQNPSQSGTRI